MVKSLREMGIEKPTEVQDKLIPRILQGQDSIACAKTGSGKTLAYMLPMVSQLKEQQSIAGIRALILVPTRELALQTGNVTKKLLKYSNMKYSLIIGGHDYTGQFESLVSNPDIIVATPGRLLEMVLATQFSFKSLKYLVLDEADQLMEAQYKEQVYQLISRLNKDRVTVLLSATIPESLKEFSVIGMREYSLVRLTTEYQLSQDLELHALETQTELKPALLLDLIRNHIPSDEQAIVFVASKYQVDFLELLLNEMLGLKTSFLYSKMDQEQRGYHLENFRSKKNQFLVVTDLCARGIDIPNVGFVINYDFPATLKTLVHRCGRTARAGRTGISYCFFNP